jgi:hypothetical protein
MSVCVYMVSMVISALCPPRPLPQPSGFRELKRRPLFAMDRMTGNLPACYLFGSLSASVLYSAYVVAFGASVYFLSNVRGRRVQPNKIILTVSVILFVCVTVVRLLRLCESSSL